MNASSFRYWALLALVLLAAGKAAASPHPVPMRPILRSPILRSPILRSHGHFMQMSVAPPVVPSGPRGERIDRRDRDRHGRFGFPGLAGAWDWPYPFPGPAGPLEAEALGPDAADAWPDPPDDRVGNPVLVRTGGGAPRILLVGHKARPRRPLPIVIYGATPLSAGP